MTLTNLRTCVAILEFLACENRFDTRRPQAAVEDSSVYDHVDVGLWIWSPCPPTWRIR